MRLSVPRVLLVEDSRTVIVLTAQPTAELAAAGRELGADGFLSKPVDLRELAIALRRLLYDSDNCV